MDYKKIVEYRNDNNNFATVNNARITEIHEGYGQAKMTITNSSYNPVGSVHGGAFFTVADIACGGAASSYGMMVTTLDCSLNFLRPAIDIKELIATANVIKRGKNIIVVNVSIVDENDRELVIGTYSFASLGTPIDI